MANNLNHFLHKADELNAEANAIRNAVAVLAPYADNDNHNDAPEPPTPTVAPTVVEFAHDIIAPTIEREAPQIVAAPSGKHRGSADDLILAVLTSVWMTARMIHEAIVAKGATITRAAVYQRMDVLAATRPNLVEQHPTDKAWRAKGGDKAPKDADDALPTLPATLVGKAARKVAVTVAANDATIAPPDDVKAPLLIKGDGLVMLRGMADRSVDLMLTDLPYGTTGTKFDPKIDVDEWMEEMHRVVTDRGSIVAFAVNPFTTDMILASRAYDRRIERFHKDSLIWEKPKATGFPQSHNRHMKAHEDILVFSRGTVCTGSKRRMTYNPQGVSKLVRKNRDKASTMNFLGNGVNDRRPGEDYDSLEGCPRSVLYYPKDNGPHPFAKPVALLEYLVRTYSNPGELVADPTMGSGSAGVAAINTGRRFIGAENGVNNDGECIYSIAKERIAATLADKVA